MPPTIIDDHARSILTENVVDDVDYRWTLNPYRGCELGCTYCYARGSHEYLDLDPDTEFATKLVVKRDAPELLRAAFDRPGWHGATLLVSPVTDPYQPIEAELELTRRCLEVCLEYRNPVRVITKATLALRDVDLFGALARDARFQIDVSIAFMDADQARLFEPGAPSVGERFELIAQLARAGLAVGVMVAPVIAGLNDAQLAGVLERAAAASATSACWVPVRLPEPIGTIFPRHLRAALPRTADSILHRIGASPGPYLAMLAQIFATTCARVRLAPRPFSKAAEALELPTTFRRPEGPGSQLSLFQERW